MKRVIKKLLRPAELIRLAGFGVKFLKKNGPIHTAKFAIKLVKDHGIHGAAEAFFLRLTGTPPVIGEWGRARLAHQYVAVAHDVPVDVIICVHNALEDVKNCLESLLRETLPPYHLILVDDGSDAETRDFLKKFTTSQGAKLIRHEVAKGYTKAANAGMRASAADLVCLLNSDTIVTPFWLDRMVACLLADRDTGLCGPLSNTASWQSIPETLKEGDWVENTYPAGVTPKKMALMLAASSPRRYPKVGFLNGFCLLIRKALINDIGMFDEETFGAGYGEENDFCLRAQKAGWNLAVADDAYVHHAQSKSYSHERRKVLAENADKALHAKHGGALILERLAITKDNPVLEGIRARAALFAARQKLIEETRTLYEGKRVSIVLPVLQSGGGGNVILREAEALSAMGVNVSVVNLMINYEIFDEQHPNLQVPMHYIRDLADLKQVAEEADAVIATLFLSVHWIAQHVDISRKGLSLGYYIQDFEPHFFAKDNPMYQQAWDSYTRIPNMRLLTKSRWNRDEIFTNCERDAALLGPSYAWNMFYPSMQKSGGDRVRITAMIRPNTPRRAPELTLRVLKRLKRTFGERVEIITFGVNSKDEALKSMETDFAHINAGELPTMQVAGVLDASDVFLDFSVYQAMGLTALEAMACGVAVVAPLKGGSGEFIAHEKNGLLVDTSNEEACFQMASRLIEDRELRQRIQHQALRDAVQYYPEKSARKLLDALLGETVIKQKEEAYAHPSAA